MVYLLTGQKGSGKTQKMIELANQKAKACDGNVVFIKNSHNDTYSVSFDIRAILGYFRGKHWSALKFRQ